MTRPDPRWLARLAATTALTTAAVMAIAAVQHRVVLGVALHPRLFALPAVVGLTFGVLLALVRESRARERAARQALASREADYQRLNEALEERVAERTAALEQRTAEFLRAQKMEVLGLMAGGVAHDLNNILTAVMGCAAALRDEASRVAPAPRAALAEVLDELDESADRARRLTHQLLTLGRGGAARPEPLDLGEVIGSLTALLARLLGENIRISTPAPTGRARVHADRSQLEQLLLNLAVNARDAMPSGGTLTLSAERAGAQVYLVVADTGTGMDAATRIRLFEPFFTTKARGRGTGLGMSVVQEVVRRAGGRVDVESQPGRGTRVCVTLPATEEPAAAQDHAARWEAPSRALRVLLVEDDGAVRRRLVAGLVAAGHVVLEAGRADEAERLVRTAHLTLDAAVIDVVLPDGSGPGLAERLARMGVAVPVVLMSGHAVEALDGPATAGQVSVLQKPFPPAALLARLAELTDRRLVG